MQTTAIRTVANSLPEKGVILLTLLISDRYILFAELFVISLLCYDLFFVNLYKEYTSLKSRELEELPRFQVMSWQPF